MICNTVDFIIPSQNECFRGTLESPCLSVCPSVCVSVCVENTSNFVSRTRPVIVLKVCTKIAHILHILPCLSVCPSVCVSVCVENTSIFVSRTPPVIVSKVCTKIAHILQFCKR